MSLLIIKAKPNPTGKDRTRSGYTPATQLAAEWVDFKNMGESSADLRHVDLYHLAYLSNGATKWEIVTDFQGILQPNKVVRVHSGNPIPIDQMNYEDRIGVDYHIFSGKNYVWNNNQSDYPGLWYKPSNQWLDKTEYNAYPQEGKILQRYGNKLI